jgi:hypothetical protein
MKRKLSLEIYRRVFGAQYGFEPSAPKRQLNA